MGLGKDAYDELAHALVQTDFDAVERGGLRAEWTADGTTVEVFEPDGDGEPVRYTGEDLVRATSDREVDHAREPEGT